MKSLNAQLLAFKSSVFDRADRETAQALRQLEADARAETAQAKVLKIGDPAPDFTLADDEGKMHRLVNYLSQGPVFVLFFKGGWCPYSSLTLRAWEDIATKVRKSGGQLLAISPQKASRAALVRESNGVSFPVLADCGSRVAEAFGVATQAKPIARELLAKMGCNLPEENDGDVWTLPRAAEFLIGSDGIIRLAHVSPVYFERLEPQEGLEALRRIKAESLAQV